MLDLQLRLRLRPLVPEDLEVKRVGKLRLLQFPYGQGIVLLRKAGLHELRPGLENIKFHEGTGIEVDHQRPSRSASTVS